MPGNYKMTNIIKFTGYTTNDIEPNNVLNGALDKLDKCLVLGHCDDGDFYCASSTSNVGELLRIVEIFKFKLIRGDFD